jgi:hypothetical protein
MSWKKKSKMRNKKVKVAAINQPLENLVELQECLQNIEVI